MKNMNFRLFRLPVTVYAIALTLVFQACKNDDDPKPANEEELITTVALVFQKLESDEPARRFEWKDVDGTGAGAPVIDEIELDAHAAYSLSVELKDESNPNDVEDITSEIEEEGTEHQFFFTVNPGDLDIDITYNDEDADGKPIGLINHVAVGHAHDVVTGTLGVTLRHKPKKDAAGVANGDITNAAGDTDIEVVFNVNLNE